MKRSVQKSLLFIRGHSPCFVLCFAFPLFPGVVLRASLREHGIRDLEVAMRFASVADCVPGTIKLLRCGGLTDWAKERPGQRSATFSNPSPC